MAERISEQGNSPMHDPQPHAIHLVCSHPFLEEVVPHELSAEDAFTMFSDEHVAVGSVVDHRGAIVLASLGEEGVEELGDGSKVVLEPGWGYEATAVALRVEDEVVGEDPSTVREGLVEKGREEPRATHDPQCKLPC